MRQPEQEHLFDELVAKVQAVDIDAAMYLSWNLRELNEIDYNFTEDLNGCMTWEETPQGFHYWMEIHHKILTNEQHIEILTLNVKPHVSVIDSDHDYNPTKA